MDFNKYYEKLPKKIKESEKILLYCIKLSKKLRKISRKKPIQPNNTMNFLFKHTNIETKGPFRQTQIIYTELLKFIDNICEKYDLDYFLGYGTLLGAYRHNGFIPWDDDCDIIMMREDYNKFLEILPQEINQYDYLKEEIAVTRLIGAKENYFKEFNTIYDESLGHFDFYDKTNDAHKLFLQIGFIKPLIKLDIFTYEYLKEEYVNYYNDYYLGHKLYFRKLLLKPDFSFEKEYNERYQKLGFTLHETKYIGEGLDGSDVDNFGAYETDIILPTKRITFENYSLKCPNKPQELLKIWYGETYMDIPSELDIHDYIPYSRTLFKSEDEMENKFNEIIENLREINNNFKK